MSHNPRCSIFTKNLGSSAIDVTFADVSTFRTSAHVCIICVCTFSNCVATWLVVYIPIVARFIKIHEFVSKHTGTVRCLIHFPLTTD